MSAVAVALLGVIGAALIAVGVLIAFGFGRNAEPSLGRSSSDVAADEESLQVTDPGDGSPVGSNGSLLGTQEAPFRIEAETTVVWQALGQANNSVWNTTVGALRDVTAETIARDPSNGPVPQGAVFVAFDVEMSLVDARSVPLSQDFNFAWEILGGETGGFYEAETLGDGFGCGTLENSFDPFDEVFLGGTVRGTVCIPIPREDFDSGESAVALGLRERVFFAADGTSEVLVETPPVAPEFEVSDRIGTRESPHEYGQAELIDFEPFGSVQRAAWIVTVSEPSDITAVIVDDFNSPPPDGAVYAGFDVSLTLDDASVEPLSAGFNMTFEVIGGASAGVFTEFTLQPFDTGCGIVPDPLDDFAQVGRGETLQGMVCITIPADDLTHPNSRFVLRTDSDTRIAFG